MAQKVNPVDPESDEAEKIRKDFGDHVNMTASELDEWLETDESKDVGQKDGGGESVGHDSGRRIVKLLGTKQADLSAEDIGHMKKTNGYVSRHLKQRPKGDVEDSNWRYSLMNWGHDPLK